MQVFWGYALQPDRIGNFVAKPMSECTGAEILQELLDPVHEAMKMLTLLEIPIICAINGAVGGGGIGFALCGDIVLAAESMKLRGGYSAIGLTPDVGGSWFVTRRARWGF